MGRTPSSDVSGAWVPSPLLKVFLALVRVSKRVVLPCSSHVLTPVRGWEPISTRLSFPRPQFTIEVTSSLHPAQLRGRIPGFIFLFCSAVLG